MSRWRAPSEYSRATSITLLDRYQSSLDPSIDLRTIDDNATSQAEGLLPREGDENRGDGVYTTVPRNDSVRGASSDDTSRTERATNDARQPYKPLTKSQTLSKWVFEILALFVSVSAFVAIVITLKTQNGKPPPESAYLNTNTLIAISSTILRATVTYIVAEVISQSKWSWMETARPLRHLEQFHNASMGPWGSFKFIFITWKPTMSAISASIIILSAAIGPFSQQAATNNICRIPKPYGDGAMLKVATDSRINMDGAGNVANAINGLMYGASDSSAAISSLFKCESSNCTFGDEYPAITHSSIGICSACTAVASSLKEFNRGTDGIYYQFAEGTNFSVSESERRLDMRVTSVSRREDWGEVSGANITVSTIAMRTTASPKDEPVAANCTIYPCLRQYNANVTNGILNESVVSRAPMKLQPGNGSQRDFKFITVMDPCVGGFGPHDRSSMSSASNSVMLKTPRDNIQARLQCLGSIDSSFYGTLFAFLNETVAGTCGSDSLGKGPQGCDKSKWWTSSLFREGNATFESISSAFDGMAIAITNYMRANGGTHHGMNGREIETYICLKADMFWLLYPGALLILATIALIGAIGDSFADRGRQPVWKSQILPLLFYNVRSQQPQDSFERVPLLQIDQMETLADKTLARFSSYAETVAFVVEEKE